MKTFFVVLLLSTACARHHESSGHHHHAKEKAAAAPKYNSVCAESLAEGDGHVMGKKEFSLEHGGEIYYFSSKEKMKKFESNLTENIKRAEENWGRYR